MARVDTHTADVAAYVAADMAADVAVDHSKGPSEDGDMI